MKIGKIVQHHIPAIFEYCETKDPAEFTRLQDSDYSKAVLDINYPFCKPDARIGAEEQVRYYSRVHMVFGVPVRVTSQWFNPQTSKSLPLFQQCLRKRGIPIEDPVEKLAAPTRTT